MVRDSRYPYEEKRKIEALVKSLRTLIEKDPEQEVQGMALPVFDAVVETVRAAKPDDLVVAAVRDIISPEQIALGDAVRAADALLVAEQLDAALGDEPPFIAAYV